MFAEGTVTQQPIKHALDVFPVNFLACTVLDKLIVSRIFYLLSPYAPNNLHAAH